MLAAVAGDYNPIGLCKALIIPDIPPVATGRHRGLDLPDAASGVLDQ